MVVNEHTLGYEIPGFALLGSLKGDVFAGGNPDPLVGMIARPMDESQVRDATLADFERFRVQPPPHMR